MWRALVLVATLTMLVGVLAVGLSAARSQAQVTGAGEGTFFADLDGDGDTDGSFFWIDVRVLADGTAEGAFECLMAGRWDFLELPLMLVDGTVSNGSVNPDRSVTFSGTAKVNIGDGPGFSSVPYTVTVRPGGAGKGTLALTVLGAFDGVPGDTIAGNGNYDLQAETVASGHIKVDHRE